MVFIKKYFKLIISISLILIFIKWIDIKSLKNTFSKVSITFLINVLFFQFLIIYSQSLRLFVLIQPFVNKFSEVIKLSLIAQLFSNFLPGSVAGDVYKVWYIKEERAGLNKAISFVTLDRLSGLLIVILMGVLALIITDKTFSSITDYISFSYNLIILFIILFVICVFIYKNKPKIKSFINELFNISTILSGKKIKWFIMMMSVVFLFRLVKYFYMIHYFGYQVSLVDVALILFFLQLVTILPLSMGGLGIMEFTILILLQWFGISFDVSAAIAVINRLSIWVVSLPGFYFWFFLKKEIK